MSLRHPATGSNGAARLLLIERDLAAGRAIAGHLGKCFSVAPQIAAARGGREAAELLRAESYDVVLLDLASLDELEVPTENAVARLVKLAAGALIIALTDGGSVSAAVGAMRAGAHDYIAKPIDGETFATRIGELAHRHGKARALTLQTDTQRGAERYHGFVGSSMQMRFVYEQIERAAASSAPVFITGESGTGKELCAEALHESGPRAGRRFVGIDCAIIPQETLEGALFGSAGGADGRPNDDCKGAVELANGGTLFLDEIGGLGLGLQGKLLRFLQTGTVTRLGEVGARKLDVRVICATRANPMQLIAERTLREDLFYRLHVLPIHLPALRQRPSDILVLAGHFLTRYAAEEHKSFSGLSADAADLLIAREWPGNVSQLMQLMRRLVVIYEGGEITARMIGVADLDSMAPAPLPAPETRRRAVLPMWQQEQRIIEEAIQNFGGNIAMAAAALELSPSTIYRKRQSWAGMDQQRQGAA